MSEALEDRPTTEAAAPRPGDTAVAALLRPAATVPLSRPRTALGSVALYAKGLATGVSDLVPGFSGGTMALLLGVYHELLAAIGSFTDPRFLRALGRARLLEAFRLCHGPFLLVYAAGIFTAIVALAPLASHLLTSHPTHVAAFFYGLVLASTLVAGRLVTRWRPLEALLLLAGAAGAFVIVGLTPAETPGGPLFLALSGALAVCALVLPGLSGSFVLVLLGKYDVALAAVAEREFLVLLPLLLGGVVGAISIARLLSHLLKRFHDPMMALLTGFVLGSLRKVWPYLSAEGGAAWPWTAVGPDPWSLAALVVAGLVAVLALERAGRARARASRSS